MQKYARSKCEISPLMRAGFCIMLQNYGLLAHLKKINEIRVCRRESAAKFVFR